MSLHRVRLRYSETGGESFHGWLEVWLTNMAPWEARPNEVPTLRDEPQPHYAGNLVFDWSEDRAHILDNLDGYLSSYCDWYRIGYHICDHDEDDRDGCSWDEQREDGTVPEFVPDFNPQ